MTTSILSASALHFVVDLAGRMLGPTTETQRWSPGPWLGLEQLVFHRVEKLPMDPMDPMDPMGRKEKGEV